MTRLLHAALALAAGLFLWAGPAAAQGNPCGLNPAKIITEIRHPHKSELTVLVAHRGMHAQLHTDAFSRTPENSRESLDNVAATCFEAAEIDIRRTSDGVLVLSHDFKWGREAEVPQGGICCYDPWKDTGGNPDVGSVTFQQTKIWKLRNFKNWQTGIWAETPVSLPEILNHYKSKGFGFVLFIDVKNKADFRQAWINVVQAGMNERVVFKIGATEFPRAIDFSKFMSTNYLGSWGTDANHINFMPVYNTGDIGNQGIAGGRGESGVLDSLTSYEDWEDDTGQNFFAAAEVNMKAPGAILASLLINLQRGDRGNFSSGIFHPITEYGDPKTNSYYYRSDASCCNKLSAYYFNGGSSLPSDTVDLRENRPFILQHVSGNYFNIVTSDDVYNLNSEIAKLNRRNTLKYFK